MTFAPVTAIVPVEAGAALAPLANPPPPSAARIAPSGFARLLLDGVQAADQKVAAADEMVRAFALDDGVPLHQVTYALEQARLAVELVTQVRARFVEGYQELMRMQL